MKSITITDSQALILDSQDDCMIDALMRDLRKQAQALATASGQPMEIYHPDGFVIDSAVPEQ